MSDPLPSVAPPTVPNTLPTVGAVVPLVPDLTAAIAANAAAPRTYAIDGESGSQHSLPDLIAADRYLASKRAGQRRRLGLRMVKLCPGNSADVTVGRPGRDC